MYFHSLNKSTVTGIRTKTNKMNTRKRIYFYDSSLSERALLAAGDAMSFIPAPRNRDAVVLELRSSGAVRVALDATGTGSIGDATMAANEDSPPSLSLVLGQESWLSRGDVRVVGASTPGLLSHPLWVSWEHGEIAVGRGSVLGKEEVLRWTPQAPAGPVRRLGFAAANFGESAQVRVWNYNAEAGFSQVKTYFRERKCKRKII